jgi:hypothetical protein
MSTSIDTGLNPFNFITLSAQRLSERTVLLAFIHVHSKISPVHDLPPYFFNRESNPTLSSLETSYYTALSWLMLLAAPIIPPRNYNSVMSMLIKVAP